MLKNCASNKKMCRCSSPEVDMIYNKLENFPFPVKCSAIIYRINSIQYTVNTKPSTTENQNAWADLYLRCCFNLIIETSTINSQFVGKIQRTPKKFWTETTTYSLIIYKQTTLIIIWKSTCWSLKLYKYTYLVSLFVDL